MRLRPNSFRPLLLATPVGLLSAAAAKYAVWVSIHYGDMAAKLPADVDQVRGVAWLLAASGFVTAAASAALFVCFLLALLRRGPWALSTARLGFWLSYFTAGFFIYMPITVTEKLDVASTHLPQGIPEIFDPIFALRQGMWAVGLILLAMAALHGWSFARSSMAAYRALPDESADGQLITSIHAPISMRYRRSIFLSVFAHLFFMFMTTFIAGFNGCMQAYVIPGGAEGGSGGGKEGEAKQEVVKIRPAKAIKKPNKRRQFIVRQDSAISFYQPKMEDSGAYADVQETTEQEYQSDRDKTIQQVMALEGGSGGGSGGGVGAGTGQGHGIGGKGKGTGWGGGSGNGIIRFIRIEYNGENWDDGMDESSRADMNFLDYVRKVSGFKIGEHPESNRISQLARYPKGFAPPFVYMTGGDKNAANSSINVPPSDVKGLREYLLNGGMLFADCGSYAWDRSFRSFMGAVFPDKQFVTIADDDAIFQTPFPFPNGAPPLWHHGGFKAMGIKHQGRWVVFYFPGDLNDAWKTGHSGLRQDLAEDAYKLGIDVIGYAFEHYLEVTRKATAAK